MNIGEKVWVVKGGIIIEPQNSKTEFGPRQYDITTILESPKVFTSWSNLKF
jgi:hypothetical protein